MKYIIYVQRHIDAMHEIFTPISYFETYFIFKAHFVLMNVLKFYEPNSEHVFWFS